MQALHSPPRNHTPWNKGKLTVQKPPLRSGQYVLARRYVQTSAKSRCLSSRLIASSERATSLACTCAAGSIAVNDLMSSPHDGHTLLLIQGGIVSETPLAVKTTYDPFKGLKPLVQLTRTGLVLVGNTNFPAKNLKELIAYVKANPGKVSYASYASGMRGHTTGLQFNKLAGLDMIHIGYKGSPPALQDVMGGHVPLMVDGIATSLPMIKAGKIKAFAVNTPTRISSLPDVPTFAELGFPTLSEVGWMGLWSTPDVPAAVQAKVRQASLQYLQQPKAQERIKAIGMEVGLPLTTEELTKDLHTAHARQEAILRSINFKAE